MSMYKKYLINFKRYEKEFPWKEDLQIEHLDLTGNRIILSIAQLL